MGEFSISVASNNFKINPDYSPSTYYGDVCLIFIGEDLSAYYSVEIPVFPLESGEFDIKKYHENK